MAWRRDIRLTAKEIALQIGGGRLKRAGKGYMISCPVSSHPDRTPSCEIWDTEKGFIGIKCHSRCGSEAPREALIEMGYIKRPAKTKGFDKRSAEKRFTEAYEYHDPSGKVHQINKRFDYYKDGIRTGAKDVYQYKADGETHIGGGWTTYLFNLPAVIQAAKTGRVIIAAEGEPKAILLKEIDRSPEPPLAATTHSGGSKNMKGWLSAEPWKYAKGCAYWAQLEDNDLPGLEFAIFVCYFMHKHGIPVKRVGLPGLGPRKPDNGLDVKDWMPGHSLDELLEIIDSVDLWTPDKEPERELLSKIKEKWDNVVEIKSTASILCLTDIFAADHFKQFVGDSVIWVPENPEKERWLVYDQTHYQVDRRKRVHDLVEKANAKLNEAVAPFKPDPNDLKKFLQRTCNRGGLSSTLERAEQRCAVNKQDLDRDIYAYNLLNGTLDLRTGKMANHARTDLITKIVRVRYNPKAKCPKFKEFLKRIFEGDQEIINFDQRYTGYCLSGDISEQSLVFGYAPGGNNGKSTHARFKLLCAGDYGRVVLADMFLSKKERGDVHSESLDRLVGYRLISVGEIPSAAKLNDQLLKDLTSGKPVEARPFGAKPYEFMPQCHLLFESNYKPSSVTDEAFWRRILYLPYRTYFKPHERDKHFAERVWEEEAEGIVAHYVEGAIAFFEDGPMISQEIKDFTESIKYENDPIKQFFEGCVRHLPEYSGKFDMTLAEVHAHLEAYRQQERFEYTVSPTKLKQELERLGVKIDKGESKRGPWIVRGVAMLPDAPRPKEKR